MREKTRLVELDIRSGIFSNESPYVVGPRLMQATNCVFDYRYPRVRTNGSTGPWMLRHPLTFPITDLVTYTGAKSFRDIAFTANGGLPVAGNGVILLGCNASDQYEAYDTAGAVIPFTGGVGRFTLSNSNRRLGCSTWWASPGTNPNGGAVLSEGITVFSHPSGTHVYYLLDSGAGIRSLTTDVTNCPAGAASVAVHIDRLWLVKGDSLVYTNPFDCDTIDANNEIIIGGDGRCLIPGQLGTIDATGVPHLVIGHAYGVQVLDGDPNLGNAAMRTLIEGVGMESSHVAAVTPYGVFFVGTDADLWHIPLGMQEVRPVGYTIRDRLGINNVTGAIDTGLTSVVWFSPYLYVFPAGETANAYVLEPTRDGIAKAWGPVALSTLAPSGLTTRPGVVRAPSNNVNLHAPSASYVPSVHSIDNSPSSAQARYMAFDTLTTNTAGNAGRTASFVTGFLHEPGHQVQANRIILETLRVPQVNSADVTWTVRVSDERGNSALARRDATVPAPTAGTYQNDNIATQHFTLSNPLPAARAIAVTISCTASADLSLVRAFVEMHVTANQR